jgi:hypothetical protein
MSQSSPGAPKQQTQYSKFRGARHHGPKFIGRDNYARLPDANLPHEHKSIFFALDAADRNLHFTGVRKKLRHQISDQCQSAMWPWILSESNSYL